MQKNETFWFNFLTLCPWKIPKWGYIYFPIYYQNLQAEVHLHYERKEEKIQSLSSFLANNTENSSKTSLGCGEIFWKSSICGLGRVIELEKLGQSPEQSSGTSHATFIWLLTHWAKTWPFVKKIANLNFGARIEIGL